MTLRRQKAMGENRGRMDYIDLLVKTLQEHEKILDGLIGALGNLVDELKQIVSRLKEKEDA